MTRFRTSSGIILWLIVSLTSPLLAGAQQPPPLTGDDRAAIIDQIGNALLETYVFPEDAEVMTQRLASQLESGSYDDASDVTVFCNLLNQDLHSVRRDLHLHVDFAPLQPSEPGTAQQADEEQRILEKLPRLNYGFRKLELLEGNIGYLRLDAFVDAGLGGATAIAAMSFLANADAMIFDLRNNGGGSPSMIQLISSYLFASQQLLHPKKRPHEGVLDPVRYPGETPIRGAGDRPDLRPHLFRRRGVRLQPQAPRAGHDCR